MPRFPAVTSRQVVTVLGKLGFEFSRQAGTSHAIYRRKIDGKRTVVPVHAGRTIKRRTLAAILRDAGIDVERFKEML